MNKRYIYGSLTRTSDLTSTEDSWLVHPLKRDEWETGDYVVGKFVAPKCTDTEWVELTNGRHATLVRDDLLVGALGVRKATLESVGNWHSIGNDGLMQDLTRAGLFGKEMDHSPRIPPHPSFLYQGHVIRSGMKVTMQDFVRPTSPQTARYDCPTILILGTSMSVGKTCTARAIIRLLKRMGVERVVGVKLAGAGCLSDILSMHDAGANAFFDFVDVGLPSTAVPPEQYKKRLELLLSMVSSQQPNAVVAEAGASPLEPYNDSEMLVAMADSAQFVVLCASDAYSVVGFKHLLGIRPDVVTGIATATSAGRELVEKLSGVPALSLTTNESSMDEFKELLMAALKDSVSLK